MECKIKLENEYFLNIAVYINPLVALICAPAKWMSGGVS